MAEIVFLGTSCGLPTPDRNHPSIHFRHGEHRFLFDCGENVQRQLAVAKLSPMKINHVFITHLHGDHFFGLLGLIQSSYWRERTEALHIYGPKGTETMVGDVMRLVERGKPFDIVIKEVLDGAALKGDGFTVSAFPVKHAMPGVGYVFEESERTNIDEAALRRLGLLPGPLYGQLKAGKTVEWKGKTLTPADYVKTTKGIKFVYTGDTAPSETTIAAAEGATMLVHEATFADSESGRAEEATHSTARGAARVALQANVKQLVLTHFSIRYDDAELLTLLDEAKEEFENTILAKDFMKLEI